MKIGVDLDGVIANFGYAFWQLLNELHGKNYPFQEPVGWCDWPPWTREELDAGWPVLAKKHDWWLYNVSTYPFNVDSLAMWMHSLRNHKHDVYFITSRTPSAGNTVLTQVQRWLDAYNLVRPGVSAIVADKPSHKARIAKGIGLDAAIDDKLETVVEGNKETKWTLLDRPWNRDDRPDGIHVVSSLEEWLDGLDAKS